MKSKKEIKPYKLFLNNFFWYRKDLDRTLFWYANEWVKRYLFNRWFFRSEQYRDYNFTFFPCLWIAFKLKATVSWFVFFKLHISFCLEKPNWKLTLFQIQNNTA